MTEIRFDHELPEATAVWGWKYHHIGIPTSKVMPEETYLPQFKIFVSGFSTSPFGIEWMRFEKDSTISDLIRNVPHIAFEVNDLDFELKNHNFKIISEPVSTNEGTRVAMVEHDGAPIELIEFEMNKNKCFRPGESKS